MPRGLDDLYAFLQERGRCGGYGDPAARDPRLERWDRDAGYVTAATENES